MTESLVKKEAPPAGRGPRSHAFAFRPVLRRGPRKGAWRGPGRSSSLLGGPGLRRGLHPFRDPRGDEDQELGVVSVERLILEQPAKPRDLRKPRYGGLAHGIVQLEYAA